METPYIVVINNFCDLIKEVKLFGPDAIKEVGIQEYKINSYDPVNVEVKNGYGGEYSRIIGCITNNPFEIQKIELYSNSPLQKEMGFRISWNYEDGKIIIRSYNWDYLNIVDTDNESNKERMKSGQPLKSMSQELDLRINGLCFNVLPKTHIMVKIFPKK